MTVAFGRRNRGLLATKVSAVHFLQCGVRMTNLKEMFVPLALLVSSCGAPQVSGVFFQSEVAQGLADAYRKALPPPLEMPDTLRVLVVISELDGPSYREAGLMLLAVHDGHEGWFPLSMPMNNAVGYAGGIPYGYPKYLTDLQIKKQSSGTIYGVDESKYTLLFRPDTNVIQTLSLEKVFSRGSGNFSFAPDGCLKSTKVAVPDGVPVYTTGWVEFENNAKTGAIAQLFPSGTYQGVQFSVTGDVDMSVADAVCGLRQN
jgi:hypothetical protein